VKEYLATMDDDKPPSDIAKLEPTILPFEAMNIDIDCHLSTKGATIERCGARRRNGVYQWYVLCRPVGI